LSPQQVVPALQVPRWLPQLQVPFVHVLVPLGQTFPQLPQLLVSLLVFTHWPLQPV
jgi:hypothetical protein